MSSKRQVFVVRSSWFGAKPVAIRKRYNELRTPNSEPRAFTLVELLVVIAILGILASLVAAGAQAARRKGAVTKAKTAVAAMETAISMYYGDMGKYPATGNEGLVKALQDDPGDANWNGPYMEFKKDDLKDGKLVDPWGHPYEYVSLNGGAPQHRPKSYDLLSVGPNGIADGEEGDDIGNW